MYPWQIKTVCSKYSLRSFSKEFSLFLIYQSSSLVFFLRVVTVQRQSFAILQSGKGILRIRRSQYYLYESLICSMNCSDCTEHPKHRILLVLLMSMRQLGKTWLQALQVTGSELNCLLATSRYIILQFDQLYLKLKRPWQISRALSQLMPSYYRLREALEFIIIQEMAHFGDKITQIQDKVNKIYQQMEALQAEAKAFLQKSKASKGSAKQMYKQKCLMALKKKKQLEQQAKSYNSHQNALQQANFTLENVNNHKQMYAGLKGAVEAQKEAMKNVDIDKLDDLRDEMMDLKMESDMMNEMLARNYDMDYDEDQFQDEFMEFQKEVAVEKKKMNVPNAQKQEIKGNSNNIDDILKL